jgi:hypothetical protein
MRPAGPFYKCGTSRQQRSVRGGMAASFYLSAGSMGWPLDYTRFLMRVKAMRNEV